MEEERTVAQARLEIVLDKIDLLNKKLQAHVKLFKLHVHDKAINHRKAEFGVQGDAAVYLEVKKMKQDREDG